MDARTLVGMFPASGLFAASQPGLYVQYDRSGDWLRLDQDWFKGAQWKLVDPDPADPFAGPTKRYSQDDDLP